jgi:hypothetical protein
MSQAATGRKGRKNCRVMGRRREVKSSEAMAVLPIGPGAWMRESEKMPIIMSKRYWKS